jgi:hypothetical protein
MRGDDGELETVDSRGSDGADIVTGDDTDDLQENEQSGTIGDSVVTGSDSEGGVPADRRSGGRNDVPSYAPTDPGWVTDDFSSIDLGQDVDSSPKPVRRLDLPPLADAPMTGSELSSSPPAPGLGAEPAAGEQSNELGVFGASGNPGLQMGDTTMSGPRRRGSAPMEPVGFPSGSGIDPAPGPLPPPKQGVPPHPLSAGGADLAGSPDDRTHLRAVAPPPGRAGPDDDRFGAFSSADRGFEERFAHDAFEPALRGDRSDRASLELAPPLAVKQQRRSWLLPVVGLLAVAGLAAGYFLFVLDGSDSTDTFAVDENDPASDLVEDDLEPEGATADSGDASTDTAAVTELADNPVLTLAEAADGPMATETEYEMTIDGVPQGAEYLVIVDELPQGTPLTYLPVLILPEGRHTLQVEVTAGGKTATTNPVDVYVLAPQLTATHRANLSSVNIVEEGWAEALRQFDEFRAAGHDGLMLSPSDPYPSLLPGYWNLYVPGFSGPAEAQAYCEGADLAIPDECFPAPFDPDAPARDS